MLILHISTECYPIVRSGGLADVTSALSKYLVEKNIDSRVIIPFVDNNFTHSEELINIFEGSFYFGEETIEFCIYKNNSLSFDLYFVYIAELLDKPNIYGYPNDALRFLAFQTATLEWLKTWTQKIDTIHCHDHNTGLIPFFTKYSYQYEKMMDIPAVFTIHNTNYQGMITWDLLPYFPCFEPLHTHWFIWKNTINSMAAGIRCADKLTTVSPNYKDQLCTDSHGLEYIFQINRHKCSGILNGIDADVWNPETDFMVIENYNSNRVEKGKAANKKYLTQTFGFDEKRPIITYIGKLTHNKGGDLLDSIIKKTINSGLLFNFIIIGEGEKEIAEKLTILKEENEGRVEFINSFEENLIHKLFAGSDFYLMPSREEPCGLGQMYALKYGTIPIVSNKGGLEDTVKNFEEKGGYGIKFSYYSIDDIFFSLVKAEKIYQDKGLLNVLRKRMMNLDFSWTTQSEQYTNLYKELILNKNEVWKLV